MKSFNRSEASAGLLASAREGLRQYGRKLRLFRRNARLYLVNTIMGGMAFGVFILLLNFYVLSLGYDVALAGRLQAVTSSVALAAALPAGYVVDRLGRKKSLLYSNLGTALGLLGMVIWRSPGAFFGLSALLGLSQSLMGVSMGPFLMENSGQEERTYLFSFNAGLGMLAQFLGSWLGGRLPGWLGALGGVEATSSTAYGWSMAVVAAIFFVGLVPLLLLRSQDRGPSHREGEATPFAYLRRNARMLGKLVLPGLTTSLGAGLLMPFLNVFFRSVHGKTDSTIGTLFAVGALGMGVGLLVAPPLADRWGKIRVVVISQGLSIPFLALLGFAPWYWLSAVSYLVRATLMNMSFPVYDAFVMEHVKEEARAMAASLVNISWNLGWAFMPGISGWLQLRYGFTPLFLGTITFYTLSIPMYWRFFGRQSEGAVPENGFPG